MNAGLYINFGASILIFVVGLMLLLRILYPATNDSAKMMFGIILMIYGVYRFINTIGKIKQMKLEERRHQLNEEKEKFLRK